MTELRCSRILALRLGAVVPETTAHHRELRDRGDMLIREIETSVPMFWPIVPGQMRIIDLKSS